MKTKPRTHIIHAMATCLDCDWESQDYSTARRKGWDHNRRTGHAVRVEIGRAFHYPRRQGEQDEDKAD